AGDGLHVRAISPAGAVGTVATLETGSGISGSETPFFYVGGLAVDAGGNLYVTNGAGTRRIGATGGTTMLDGVASLDTLGGVVTSVAGTAGASTLQLGNAPGGLPALAGVAADGKGHLFTISGNAVIRITLP